MGSRRRSRIGIALLLAAAVALAAWLGWSPAASPGSAALAPATAAGVGPPEPRLVSPALEAAGDAAREPTGTAPGARTPDPAPRRPADEPVAAAPPGVVDLLLRFVRPDQQALAPPSVRIELDGPGAERRAVAVAGAQAARVEGLAVGRWTVRADAPGFWHREQRFDLAPGGDADPRRAARLERAGRTPPTSDTVEERLILWPDRWIAIVVLTPDGRPFRSIADDLGWEPKRLFSESFASAPPAAPSDAPRPASRTVFEARARATPPDGASWRGSPEDVARFRPPPGYQSWQLGDGVLGSLELSDDPPLWVGLAYLGVPVGWELLAPGEREVVFVLEAAALDERLARVALRVVDAASGRPVEGARVTLRADTSAHRRRDLEDVLTGPDGRAVLARAMPGGHELSVAKGASLAQEHVVLAPGEARDVGDVALASGEPIPLRVVDASGAPVAAAYVELGRYEPGARVAALYPQMLRYASGDDGTFALPRPPARSIVRASIDGGRSNGRVRSDQQTANALVEADARSDEPIVLVLRDAVGVRFETAAGSAATVEAADEIGVVVDWAKPAADGKARLELLPGRYRARFLDERERVVGEAPFEVGGDGALVTWP